MFFGLGFGGGKAWGVGWPVHKVTSKGLGFWVYGFRGIDFLGLGLRV